jgi:hypothetical protein
MHQKDGRATILTFAKVSSGVFIYLDEKGVTPVGLDGGGGIDTTTKRNIRYRTKHPKSLIEVSDSSISGLFHSDCLSEIMEQINVNQWITLTFANGKTWQFMGWLNKFTPGEQVEGGQCSCTLQIIPSMETESGVEVGVKKNGSLVS